MFKRGLWLSIPSLLISLGCLMFTGNMLPLQNGGSNQGLVLARSAACLSSALPDEHSLLIVLLDRSASLAQTDPNEYSTSVTRMLANLWPGRMAVIFFKGATSPLPQLGPLDLTQPGARTQLQTQIEAQKEALYGDTPTQYAVEQASKLLEQNGYPGGSEVMLITDGQPFLPADQEGTKQIATLEHTDAPAFCTHGVPINTFGLGNQVPAYTQTFLQQMAAETHGTYQDVTDPAQLAAPVLQMYANWQQVKLVATGKTHQFFVDTYARQVDFIAFLSNSTTFPVTLLGPDQQPVPDQELVRQTQDIHYQFDQMALQRFNTSGTYTIHTNDASAQTYALEETRLQGEILSPAPHASLYAGQPLTISVAFFDNNDPKQHIHPTSSENITAGLTYTLQASGQAVVRGEKKLLQQPAPDDDLFSTQITLPSAGTLTLIVSASYQYVPVSDIPQLIVQVAPAPTSVCAGTQSACQKQPLGLLVGAASLLALIALVLLFFFVWRRPRPFGFLENAGKQGQGNVLGRNRTLRNRLLHISTVSSTELSGFDFQDAHFDLQFKRGRRLLLAASRQNTSSLAVWCAQKPAGQQMQPVKIGSPIPLHEHDRILIHGFPCATFHTGQPRANETAKPERVREQK